MKKETIITGVVFLSIGFLAGYVYHAQKALNQPATGAAAEANPGDALKPGSAGEAAASNTLPPGHPPVDNGALVQFFEDQASANPNDPAPRVKLANLLFDEREFQPAAEWYEKALALDPANVDARTDLGTCYFNLGRPDRALEEFHASLEVNPRHEPTLFNIVVVNLQSRRDLAAAERAWKKLHDLNPNYPHLDRLRQELDAARVIAGRKAGSGT